LGQLDPVAIFLFPRSNIAILKTSRPNKLNSKVRGFALQIGVVCTAPSVLREASHSKTKDRNAGISSQEGK